MNPARGTRPILVLTALGAALGVAFAGSAVVPPTVAGEGPRKVCIDPQFATNWRKFDDHTILVESGGRTFRLTTSRCPHLADNLPRISIGRNRIAVNGLYRHGFLIAPALAELTLAFVERGALDNEVMRCV